MDKLIVTNIDTDMIDIAPASFGSIKKDKVTRLKLFSAHILPIL